MTLYEHRQYGLLTGVAAFAALGAGLALTLTTMAGASGAVTAILGGGLGLVALLLFLFHSLRVRVTTERIEVRFGPGLISRTIGLDGVADAAPVRNHWYYGWGVRLTPHGWMFNISGLDAVEVRLTDGRRFRIGTDQPIELTAAIRRGLADPRRRRAPAS